jgi:hypothetical protein
MKYVIRWFIHRLRVGLDAVEKKKSLASADNLTPEVQPVDRHYIEWAILVQKF